MMATCVLCILFLASANSFLFPQRILIHSAPKTRKFGDEVVNTRNSDEASNETSHSYSLICQRRDFPGDLAKRALAVTGIIGSCLPAKVHASHGTTKANLRVVTDPNTYSALMYSSHSSPTNQGEKMPLLVVLHGAGNNQDGVWSLADPKGEHAGLLPSLIASNQAPQAAVDNFIVVAPFAEGKRSFYEEPRSRLLRFVDWVCSEDGQKAGCSSNIDPNRIFLFGFSDGATVAVELATTRRFKACVVCAYGYSGILPQLALDRLQGIPFWVFHSADDVIFPVRYGDQLVKSLQNVSPPSLIRYTRYDRDQEGFTGDVRGHSVGITASKMGDLYSWLLSFP